MAGTFRIPGPESVGQVAVTRDPGIDARVAGPDTFGANIGESTRRIGLILNDIGSDLLAKRQAAEDTVAKDTAQSEILPRYAQEYLEAQKQAPAGGAGFSSLLKQRLDTADKEIDDKLRGAGWSPSQRAIQAIQSQRADLRTQYSVKGTVFEHNARTTEYETQTVKNRDAIVAEALTTGDVKGGLNRVDELFSDKRGILGAARTETMREESRRAVVDAVVGGLKASGKHNEAKALISEMYGEVPAKPADAVRPAAINSVAGRLGIAPRDLAAAISYETGGTFDPNKVGGKNNNYLGLIQFGPEERAKYGVRPGMSFEQQMVAVEGFLRDRGVKPGMDIGSIYTTINGGNPNVDRNKSDGNGTIAQHIERIKAGHYKSADQFLGGKGAPPQMPDAPKAIKMRNDIEIAQAHDATQAERTAEKARKVLGDEALKEIYSRSERGSLTADAIEQARPYLTASEYHGALRLTREESASDDARAIIDLTKRIASDDPDSFIKLAGSYVDQGKLKTATFIQLTEKNRAAAKDDQPASPYKSMRGVIEKSLEPGMLVTGAARIPFAAAQQQALQEFDNWAQGKPQGQLTREEAQDQAAAILKRYAVIDTTQMKASLGLSPYFGSKSSEEVTLPDIDRAEVNLLADIEANKLTKPQQALEIRRLNNWREILAREDAAARKSKVVPSGKR